MLVTCFGWLTQGLQLLLRPCLLQDGYYQDIGYAPDFSLPPPYSADPNSRGSITQGQLAAAIACSLVAVLLLLGVGVWQCVRSRNRAGYDLFGKVRR